MDMAHKETRDVHGHVLKGCQTITVSKLSPRVTSLPRREALEQRSPWEALEQRSEVGESLLGVVDGLEGPQQGFVGFFHHQIEEEGVVIVGKTDRRVNC